MSAAAPTVPSARKPILLHPGEGRAYPMGRIGALFKADGEETGSRYSISEWWLEAHTEGPGAHSQPEDSAFYILEGTMEVLIDTQWHHATQGSFVLIPAGTTHDFQNCSDARAGLLSFNIPGAFESSMPNIAKWFREHPPGVV